jgi:hypothetical protein
MWLAVAAALAMRVPAAPDGAATTAAAATSAKNGAGRTTPPSPAGLAALCAREEQLVRIQPYKRRGPEDQDVFVLSTSPLDTEPIRLVEKVDLNDDGAFELLMEHPDEVTPDAQYFGWYLDCGRRRFYPLLTELAAEYELGKPAGNGWRLLQLYYPIRASDRRREARGDNRGEAGVRKVTYRFNGKQYVKIKEVKTQRRPLR